MSTKEAYLSLLQGLLPQGQAWNREPDSDLTNTLSVPAAELARVHDRALALLQETDPRSTSEMFLDWEGVAGLPDSCTGAADTIQERRKALVQKITGRGGQSRAYFIELAEALGYNIDITEFRPFVCGLSECGMGHVADSLGEILTGITDIEGIRHQWRVTVHGPRVTWFECGQSECGIDPLAKINFATDLECLFIRYKPAQTHLIFAYGEAVLDEVTYMGITVTYGGDPVTV